MCDNCTDTMEIPVDSVDYLDEIEQPQNAYENSFLPPLEVPLEYYDNEEFMDGFKAFQKLAGSIVALTNVGLHPSEAINYISNLDNIKHNIEVARINSEMNIEISKNQQFNSEKNQI